jgi:phosphoribosyl-AMP cyclohydrolase
MDAIEFGDDGLVPAVAQDADSGEVLMLAYADREAVERTLETDLAHYYSRSREELWQKGATSGNVQRVAEVRVDCDGDALLYRIDQAGGACHTGHRSCFHRRLTDDGLETDGERVFDPEAVYE